MLMVYVKATVLLQLLGFHTKGDGGGGVFYWDATKDKSEHNGGTVIDPDKAGLVANWASTQALYFTPEVTGQGCWVREFSGAVNVKWFGAKGDGVSDAAKSTQATINFVNLLGGGTVYLPRGAFLLKGSQFINVLENVNLIGENASTVIKSEKGGLSANYEMIYLKDNSSVKNLRLSLSDYLGKRSGDGVTNTPYNKMGITTQGASTGKGIVVQNIGMEKVQFTWVYVADNHSEISISGCYSYGQQAGLWADVDVNGLVTNWVANPTDVDHQTKINSFTRMYCLTNFHNSGSGAHDVSIFNNKIVNINDSFCAPNLGAYRHNIYDNYIEKNTLGYYGGYGIDLNGSYECNVSGNTVIGGSFGCYIHEGAFRNTVENNTFRCAHGIGHADGANRNTVSDNNIVLSRFGSDYQVFGAGAGILASNNAIRLFTSNNLINPSSINVATVTKTITNAVEGNFNRVRLTCVDHGLANRCLVEISGVVGTTEANGVWQVAYIDDDTFDLLGTTFTNSYVSGGSVFYSTGGVGFGITSGATSVILTDGGYINDIGVGVLASSNGDFVDYSLAFSNVPVPYRGGRNLYTNNISSCNGLSSTGTRSKNLSGSFTIVAGTTTTSITFNEPESNIDYRVFLGNDLQNLGLYFTNKTVNGFTVNHASPSYNRNGNWFIVR
jgi:parallel beta-helix repeat protein